MTERIERQAAGGRANRPMSLSRPAVLASAVTAAEQLADRLESLDISTVAPVNGSTDIHEVLRGKAKSLATMLMAGRGVGVQIIAAERIVGGLIDPALLQDPTWWSCDLARAVARQLGYVDPIATRTAARYVLHVSRQAIDQMVARGDLDAARGLDQPGVTRESLRRAARKRFPYEADTGEI